MFDTFYSVLLRQDPLEFLKSRVWGCQRGFELSSKCKQRIEVMLLDQERANGSESNIRADVHVIVSLLDCYAHSQICSYCIPVEEVAHQRSEAVEERIVETGDILEARIEDDSAGNQGEITIGTEPAPSISEESARNEPRLDSRRERFNHPTNRILSNTRMLTGRTRAPVWNMEAARLRQTE